MSIDDYQIGRYLGKGKYGVVYLARETKSGMLVALKVLFKEYILKEKVEGQLKRELEIHQNLVHPNIARIYTWFQDQTRIFIVLEYCPLGELYMQLTNFGKLPLKVVSKIAYDVVNGLQFAHKKSVLHRDIKLENILVSLSPTLVSELDEALSKDEATDKPAGDNTQESEQTAQQAPTGQNNHNYLDDLNVKTPDFLLKCTFKLADFGWSVHHPGISQKSILNVSRRKTQCGTLDYLPPQIVLGQPYHYGCDIWSLGVMVFELLAGQPPFFHETMEITKQNIVQNKFSYPEGFNDIAKEFIKKCLVKDQDKRASAEELAKHPFIRLWQV